MRIVECLAPASPGSAPGTALIRDPSHRGRGVYAALLSSLLAGLSSQGHDRLVISTQAGNVPVQRLWARAGLLPFAAFTTVHLRHRLL